MAEEVLQSTEDKGYGVGVSVRDELFINVHVPMCWHRQRWYVDGNVHQADREGLIIDKN